MNPRRYLLLSLVLASVAQLPACGVTEWQREQDGQMAMYSALMELQSPEMEKAIAEARR